MENSRLGVTVTSLEICMRKGQGIPVQKSM
jgi:hypothetical protein